MRNKRGLTLLEIIIIIAIIGLAVPAILTAFARLVATGADAKTVQIATNLASQEMEQMIKGKKFVNIVSAGQTDYTGDFSQYNYQIIVEYVNPSDLNTPVAGPTDFKRVKVVVTKDNLAGFNVTLTTLITNLGY